MSDFWQLVTNFCASITNGTAIAFAFGLDGSGFNSWVCHIRCSVVNNLSTVQLFTEKYCYVVIQMNGCGDKVWWRRRSHPWDRGSEELRGDPIIGPPSKVWIRDQSGRSSMTLAGEPHMRDNPDGSAELDPAVDNRRRCKKNSSSLLSYADKRTKEGCDRDSEVGTVHSGRVGVRPVPLRRPREYTKEKFVREILSSDME